ncbi:hypothetical protein LTR72_011059 [Exophiala xenobiotica]|nr:hypothetical protein LTR72_011059 [Exophiala xenobiotica]
MAFDLRSFKAIFFAINATPIDWESGIYPSLLHLSQQLPVGDAPEGVVQHENPQLAYPQILEKVYERIASDLGLEADEKDRVLARHYKLFVLSNVGDTSFSRRPAGPLRGVHWDGIYTAQQIGSYKPGDRNYLFVVDRLGKDFGTAQDETLMVAQSLDIDHVSAKRLGFRPAAWIARYAGEAAMGGDREELERKGLIELGAVYGSLGGMAHAVEEAFSNETENA